MALYRMFSGSSTFAAAEGTVANLEVDIVYCSNQLFDLNCDRHQFGRSRPAHPYFPDRFIPSRLAYEEEAVMNVTSLAIPVTEFEIMDRGMASVQDVVGSLQKFPDLKELILVDAEYCQSFGGVQSLRGPWRLG